MRPREGDGQLGPIGPRNVGGRLLSAWNMSSLRRVTGSTPDRRHRGPSDHPDGSKIRARFLSRPGLLQGVWLAWVQRGPEQQPSEPRQSSSHRLSGSQAGWAPGNCADKSQVRLMQTPCLGEAVKVGWCCHCRALRAGRDKLCRLSSGTWRPSDLGVMAPLPRTGLQQLAPAPGSRAPGRQGASCQLPLSGQRHGGSDKLMPRPGT